MFKSGKKDETSNYQLISVPLLFFENTGTYNV